MSLLRAFTKRAGRKTAKPRPVALRLEALEDRLVPSSVAVADIGGGDLYVSVGPRGGVEITAGTAPGEVVVRGLDWCGLAGGANSCPSGQSPHTQVARDDVNTGWQSSVTLEGVSGDVNVLLNPQAEVVVSNLQIPGHLHIVGVWSVADPAGPTSAPAPNSEFAVHIDGVRVHDDVEIKYADDNLSPVDSVALTGAHTEYQDIHNHYRGYSHAEVHILNSDIGDDCNVEFTRADVELFGSHIGDDLDVKARSSGNTVSVAASHINSNMGLDLGGADWGPNSVYITDSTFDDDVGVNLNHDHDAMHVQRSTFHDDLEVSGDGTTVFWNGGGNSFDSLDLDGGIVELSEMMTPQTAASPNRPTPPPPGPRVIQSTPFPDHLLVTFDKPIAASSFTAAQVSILDQLGHQAPVQSIQAVPGSLGHSFNIFFTPFASGGYRAVIGPNITDTAGHAMDQNGNGVNGENPGDLYTVGNFTKPVVLSADPSYGHIRVSFNEPIAPASLTAGSVTLTDLRGRPVPVLGVHPVQWSDRSQFDIEVGAFPQYGYLLTIAPTVRDDFGNRMARNYNDRHIDRTPPQVVRIDPWLGYGVTVTFSEPMDVSRLTAAAVTVTLRNGKIVKRVMPVREVREVRDSDSRSFDIRFQADPGDYHLTIDTTVTDLFGNHLASAYQADFSVRLLLPPALSSSLRGTAGPDRDLLRFLGGAVPYHIDPTDPTTQAMLRTLTQRLENWAPDMTPSQSADRVAGLFSADPTKARIGLAASAAAGGILDGGLAQAGGRAALGGLPGSQLGKSF